MYGLDNDNFNFAIPLRSMRLETQSVEFVRLIERIVDKDGSSITPEGALE
jgi:hypothetical protein